MLVLVHIMRLFALSICICHLRGSLLHHFEFWTPLFLRIGKGCRLIAHSLRSGTQGLLKVGPYIRVAQSDDIRFSRLHELGLIGEFCTRGLRLKCVQMLLSRIGDGCCVRITDLEDRFVFF